MENVNEIILCEHIHPHALALSPAWCREVKEGFPLAWFSTEGHQLAPAPSPEASEVVFFLCHQHSPPSSCTGTPRERAVGSRNVCRKLILEQMCASEYQTWLHWYWTPFVVCLGMLTPLLAQCGF